MLIACVVLPAFSAEHWTAFGPDHSLKVTAVRADHLNSQLLYLATERGVFSSLDGGRHWDQTSEGLHGLPALSLEQAMNGTWVAGTTRGIFLLLPNVNSWRPSSTVVNEQGTPRVIHVNGITRHVMSHHATRGVLQARVNDIEIAPNRWLAATSNGIFTSSDQGKIWSGGPVNGEKEFITIKAQKELVAAATRTKLFTSVDGGTVWKQAAIVSAANVSGDVAISADSRIFVATAGGLFRSSDGGTTWEHLTNGLPGKEMGAVSIDTVHKRILAYSSGSGALFESNDRGDSWRHLSDPGTGLQSIEVLNGRVFAASANGLLAAPEKFEDDSMDATRSHGNWLLRLVHHSE